MTSRGVPVHVCCPQLPNYYRVPDLSTASPDRVCALVNVYEIDVLINGLGGVRLSSAAARCPRVMILRLHCSCLLHPRQSRLFAPPPRLLAFPASICKQKGSD